MGSDIAPLAALLQTAALCCWSRNVGVHRPERGPTRPSGDGRAVVDKRRSDNDARRFWVCIDLIQRIYIRIKVLKD